MGNVRLASRLDLIVLKIVEGPHLCAVRADAVVYTAQECHFEDPSIGSSNNLPANRSQQLSCRLGGPPAQAGPAGCRWLRCIVTHLLAADGDQA